MPRLADLIRQKYPGAYDDIPDDELEKQILAKYPEYADLAEPQAGPVSRFARSAGESTGGIIQGMGEMMMAPGNISGLASKIAEPFIFGPELTGAEKAKVGVELVTGAPISKMQQQYEEGDIAGMIGSGLPAAALAALPFLKFRRAPVTPEVLAPEPTPAIRGLLPEHRDVWIGGPSGAEGVVIPPTIEPTPRLTARVGGLLFPKEGEPTGSSVNLAELREQARLRDIYYGQGEQSGLGSLQIPDRPNMSIPPVAGDTSLGFNARTQADLPYPLNVVPERLHPRAAQTEIAKATPEAIREPIGEVYPGVQEVVLDGTLGKKEPVKISRGFVEPETYSGEGHARPGEPQLPSAPPKPKRIKSGTAEAKEVVENIKKSPEPAIANLARREAEVSEFKKRMRGTKFYQRFSQLHQLAKYKLYSAVETELSNLGPAGKQISRVLALQSKKEHALATKWESGFSEVLTKLSKEEYDEFWRLKESESPSTNPKIQRALEYAQGIDKEIIGMAQRLRISDPVTGKPVQELPGYTPRIYEEGFWEDPNRLAAAFKERFPGMTDEMATQAATGMAAGLEDKLMQSLGISRDVAETIIALGKKKSEKKIPSQYKRTLNLPGYRTDPLVWSEHVADWAKKITKTEVFGMKDVADPTSPISILIEQTSNPAYAKDLLNVIMGRRDYGPSAAQFQKINRLANGFAARAYLSMFFISNVANLVTIPLKMNLKSFAAGITNAVLSPTEARSFASGSGALYGVTRNLIEESYKRRAIYDPLRYYGMTASENMNRIIGAGSGRYYAESLFTKLKKGNIKPHEVEQLHDLTLTDPRILVTQEALSREQLTNSGFRGAELTQGLGEARKVPAGWNNPNPVIQMPLIFKRYAFQQTKVIKDALFSPELPRSVRLKNAAYLVAVSQAMGYPISLVKAGVRGTVRGLGEELAGTDDFGSAFEKEIERRKDPVRRVIATLVGDEAAENDVIATMVDNLVNSWALGMFADIMYMTTGDARDFFFDMVGGPTAGPLTDLAFKSPGLLPGKDATPFMRSATRMIPFVGPGLQRAFYPTRFQE